ncbi:Protein involved in dolichol pathway for N-glycosylation (mannosyltransferase family) [Phaffia rhodozyma]|uniref:Mannosyltransferase n=1 Tax=Phaffia rhodozyma TaxID=264483 RepID=A0A0F7SGV8_PHARH|nr:Protein involved in dolichol pathway for N-glycosylation (mannosyltransferase family) [Phaffia rhodozyma]
MAWSRRLADVAFETVPIVVSFAHVFLAPHTKVEESFSLHAIHDLLFYGPSLDNLNLFDHVSFPGPLPRSFIPSLLIAGVARPVAQILSVLGLISTKFDLQILVRLVMAAISSLSLIYLSRSISIRYGSISGRFFLLLCSTQFHLPFYMGRSLPNFLALPFVNVTLAWLISNRPGPALALLTATASIVRAELVLLLAPLTIILIFTRRISIGGALGWGAIGGFGGTGATLLFDSLYWRWHFLWPELYSIYYNVVLGKSADWGVSPRLYYLKHLPLLLLLSLPLLVITCAHPVLRSKARLELTLLPPVGMVIGMSCLGHKEWRFVAYVVVWANMLASVSAAYLWNCRKKSWLASTLALGLIGGILANVMVTAGLTVISIGNYPGGDIMRTLHQIEVGIDRPVHLYSPSLPLQTGSTLFHALRSPPYLSLTSTPSGPSWIYEKTEFEPPFVLTPQSAFKNWTHVVLPDGRVDQVDSWVKAGWEVVSTKSGFGGVRLQRDESRFSGSVMDDGNSLGAEEDDKWTIRLWGGRKIVFKQSQERVVLVRRIGFGSDHAR